MSNTVANLCLRDVCELEGLENIHPRLFATRHPLIRLAIFEFQFCKTTLLLKLNKNCNDLAEKECKSFLSDCKVKAPDYLLNSYE